MGITWDVSGFTPHLLSQKPCRSGLAVSSTVSPGPELAFVSLPSGREQREERGGRGRKGHHSGGDGDLGSWMGSVCVCVCYRVTLEQQDGLDWNRGYYSRPLGMFAVPCLS